jgi:hypothetical protein
MATATSVAHDTRPLVLRTLPVELPAGWRAEPGTASVWHRISFWPLEGLRLVAVVYLLPLTILAVGIPLGLALTGMLLGAAWVWRSVW